MQSGNYSNVKSETNSNPIMLADYPRAIVHVDGDAFFASVEQALAPSLRGRPVVTGLERGIIAAASYEARAIGIGRGIPLTKAKAMCPNLVILPSDYETYALYSKHMFDIMRTYTPEVEEYSIDEGFADITGMRRVFRSSYEEIAKRMQSDIHRQLGITVSVGLSLTKTLAKLCSKFRKPSGFTAVPGRFIHILLQKTPVEKVWGFGPQTSALLRKLGVNTAFDFTNRPEYWAEKLLGKPGRDIWHELRGNSIWKVNIEAKSKQATIIKSRTFVPASANRDMVHAELLANAEEAFAKARRLRLRPRTIGIVLRRQDFTHDGAEAKIDRAMISAEEAAPLIRRLFDTVFQEGALYRATMIVLGKLETAENEQLDLFENRPRIEAIRRLALAAEGINRRYRPDAVIPATLLFLKNEPESDRRIAPPRRAHAPADPRSQRRLAIPSMTLAC